jgi:hypothetical protein
MSVENYIKKNVSSLCDRVYIAPEIPEKKLNNSISSIALGVNPDYVLAIADTTIFGSAKEGCVFLGDTIYIRGIMEKTQQYKLEDIVSAEYKCTEIRKDNGKIEKKEEVFLYIDNNKTIVSSLCFSTINSEKFVELINGIIAEAGEEKSFETTSQTIPLALMDDGIKKAYIKIICNFAYSDDSIIDSKEYAEIISLIVRIDYNAKDRFQIRNYMCDISIIEENDTLLQYLNDIVPEGSYDILKKSLIKDILYIFRIKNGSNSWRTNNFITELQQKLKLEDKQIDLIIEAIQSDEEILSKRKNDSQIKQSMKEIAAKAGAVGVPLAAIYFSGSVIGMSAAGLTSGLATIGLGGLLGFSGMVTGLGMVVLMGVGAYKGIKKVTGISDLENNKQRELMLQAIIRNSQKSLNYLIEDVNEITRQLMEELRNGLEASKKIGKLAALLGMMSKGAQATTEKINHAEIETIISQLPQILDKDRFEELTKEATKEKLRLFVLACYIEKEVVINNEDEQQKEDSNDNKKKQFVLKEQLALNTLEQLHLVFENIGYNNVKDAALATAKVAVKGIVKNIFGQ